MQFFWRNALRSNQSEPYVELGKIDLHLLDPEQPKSRWFVARGYRRDRPLILARALERHLATGTKVRAQTTNYGEKYEVVGPLECPDGRVEWLRSIWMVEAGRRAPRLITAYPA